MGVQSMHFEEQRRLTATFAAGSPALLRSMGRSAKRYKAEESSSHTINDLVQCPACGKQTPLLLINQHLDLRCSVASKLLPSATHHLRRPDPSRRQPEEAAARAQRIAELRRNRKTAHATAAETAKALISSALPKAHPVASQPRSPSSKRDSTFHEPAAPCQNAFTLLLKPSPNKKLTKQANEPAEASQSPRTQNHPVSASPGPNSYEAGTVGQPGQLGADAEHEKQTQANLQVRQQPNSELAVLRSCPGWQEDQAEQHLGDLTSRPDDFHKLLVESHATLRGHFLFESFVNPDEEKALVHMVDTVEPSWHQSTFNGQHRGKAWGVRMDLKDRKVLPEKHPLPPLLQQLAQRMRTWIPALAKFHPTEANAIDYHRAEGQWLRAHVDDRQMSTGEIVTLSLQGAAVMTFEGGPGKLRERVRVPLPRCALQVLTGNARYAFSHAIHKADLLEERRVSITFRQSPLRS